MNVNDFNFRLSPDDQRLLDALVAAGFDREALGALSENDRRRLDALCSLLGLMKDYPVEDADDTLLHATLMRIDRAEAERAARMAFEARQELRAAANRGGFRLRPSDFISVAAVALIAVSVFWPMLATMRQRAQALACSDNLRRLGYAFSQYANDNSGGLPVAMTGIGSWDTIRNVVNLKPLIDGHYCEAGHLNCPGHHDHVGPSYSYRLFTPGSQIGWTTVGGGRVTIILSDLNPMVDAARAGRTVPPLSMTINHRGLGQNVLATDGATLWLQQPVVGQDDNIWLPRGADALFPGAKPRDAQDVVLTH